MFAKRTTVTETSYIIIEPSHQVLDTKNKRGCFKKQRNGDCRAGSTPALRSNSKQFRTELDR